MEAERDRKGPGRKYPFSYMEEGWSDFWSETKKLLLQFTEKSKKKCVKVSVIHEIGRKAAAHPEDSGTQGTKN